MATFIDIEDSIQEIVADNMTSYTEEIIDSSVDAAYNNAFLINPDNPRFCVTEFKGGFSREKPAFGKTSPWVHRIDVALYIPVTGNDIESLQSVESSARTDYQEFLTNIGGSQTYKCLGNNRSLHVREVPEPLAVDLFEQQYLLMRFRLEIMELL